jgi:hypothetical protein
MATTKSILSLLSFYLLLSFLMKNVFREPEEETFKFQTLALSLW